jgi:epoxyqueuosine reductase
MTPAESTAAIKRLAIDHGFILAGIAEVRRLDEEESKFDEWLSNGYHGDMKYMARNKDLRLDPALLVPGAKSIICLAFNYYIGSEVNEANPKIAMYARGRDYHHVIKKKLKSLWAEIKKQVNENASGRYFVDSAPVMERQWAQLAGLGWTGKNTLLIHPKMGSHFFLAEIICDIETVADTPIHDHCGTCTKCIDACPTNAIAEDGYLLKANQCISYFTIESKSAIPEPYRSNLDGWLFGCDICQKVCPWNRFSTEQKSEIFKADIDFPTLTYEKWNSMTNDEFESEFNHTPIKRMGYDRMKMILKLLQQDI